MAYTAHEEIYKGYRIRIQSDDDAQSPYDDWDMFGKMYHWHRRGFFGEDYANKQAELKELLDALIKEGGIAVPVWLYEHSGQTIRAGDVNPFHCQWDSGQVGFWAATAEEIQKEFEGDKEKAIACIKSQIETQDSYLRGNVYGYVIDKVVAGSDEDEPEYEDKDSCWGYIGDYDQEGGCLAEAKSIVDHYEKEDMPLLAAAGLLDDPKVQ